MTPLTSAIFIILYFNNLSARCKGEINEIVEKERKRKSAQIFDEQILAKAS
jgi:hypothetical protein